MAKLVYLPVKPTDPWNMTGVTCHFSLHSEMPLRGKMEWIFIPFCPCRVKWNKHAIPFYPFPVQISPACHFPMQNVCLFHLQWRNTLQSMSYLLPDLLPYKNLVVIIVVVQTACNHNCSWISTMFLVVFSGT